jgi:hypothetical protein
VDWSRMEQSTSGLERVLFIASPRYDVVAASGLLAGAALVRPEYSSVGNGCRAASNAASADGVASLQALADFAGIPRLKWGNPLGVGMDRRVDLVQNDQVNWTLISIRSF